MTRQCSAGRTWLGRRAFQRLQLNPIRVSPRRFQSNVHPDTSKPSSSGSSKTASSAEANPRPKTVPGPSWLWLEPIQRPFQQYSRYNNARPYVTQFVSVLIIYLLGDLTAQYITIQNPPPSQPAPSTTSRAEGDDDRSITATSASPPIASYDAKRTARALLIGGAIAVPSYIYFLRLGNMFPTLPTPLGITLKVLINQFTYTPLFNVYFFGSQSLLSGHTLDETAQRIKDTVPASWKNSWKVWPAVTAISFLWLKVEFRGVFAGVIAIGWQAYLSLLNQKAAKAETAEHQTAKVDEKQAAQARVRDSEKSKITV